MAEMNFSTSARDADANRDIIASKGKVRPVNPPKELPEMKTQVKPRSVNNAKDLNRTEIKKKNLDLINKNYTRTPGTARANPVTGTAGAKTAGMKKTSGVSAGKAVPNLKKASRSESGKATVKSDAGIKRKNGGKKPHRNQKNVSKVLKNRTTPLRAKKIEHTVMTVNSTKRSPFPIGIIFTMAVVAAVFMFILNISVQISECKDTVSSYKKSINENTEVIRELEYRWESKYSAINIEDAAEKYGLVSDSKLQKRYVSVMDSEDQADVIVEESDPSVPSVILSGVLSSIENIFSYF